MILEYNRCIVQLYVLGKPTGKGFMDKIAFLNQKGGVAKTTCTVSVAAMFARMDEKKVLVVDCDTQHNAIDMLMTYAPSYQTMEPCIYHGADIHDCINHVETKLYANPARKPIKTNIDVICCAKMAEEFSDIYTIRDLIAQLDAEYDYCLFDMPPQFTGLGRSGNEEQGRYSFALCALVASDYVIVPAEASRSSLVGYSALVDSVKAIRQNGWNPGIKLLGLVFTRVDKQTGMDKYIIKKAKEDIPETFNTTIRTATVIDQTEYYGVPLPYYEPLSSLTLDFGRLTSEIKARIKKADKEA